MTKLPKLLAVLLLTGVVPLTARADNAAKPWQCSSSSINLYDYGASIAAQCGYKVFPLDHVQPRPDGGRDYVYMVDGHELVKPVPPTNFDPTSASADQLAYYGYPPRPDNAADVPSWQAEVAKIRPAPPTPFVVETNVSTPNPNSASNAGGGGSQSPCNPTDLCWSGYVNSGSSYSNAYMDYYEPGQAATACSGDTVAVWTGLGGYDGSTLGQAGTFPHVGGGWLDHQAFWMVWPTLGGAQPMNLVTAQGDDVQVHVDWQSSYGRFKFWVWDTTSGQQETDYYSLGSYSASYADFIVERVQFNQNGTTIISPLRNFWTGLTVNAAQANNIGMQNYPLTKLNMFTKAGTQLESTASNSGQAFNASWLKCG